MNGKKGWHYGRTTILRLFLFKIITNNFNTLLAFNLLYLAFRLLRHIQKR